MMLNRMHAGQLMRWAEYFEGIQSDGRDMMSMEDHGRQIGAIPNHVNHRRTRGQYRR